MLDEAEARAALGALADLELVGERLDDRDPEAALGELVVIERAARVDRRIESLALVDDLDDEPVLVELVDDLDGAFAVSVGMPDGVRARLRQRELQVAEHLLRQRLG